MHGEEEPLDRGAAAGASSDCVGSVQAEGTGNGESLRTSRIRNSTEVSVVLHTERIQIHLTEGSTPESRLPHEVHGVFCSPSGFE